MYLSHEIFEWYSDHKYEIKLMFEPHFLGKRVLK